MSIGERLSDVGYAAGWRLVRALPESTARRLFDWGSDRVARKANRAFRAGGEPNQLRRNLARVIGGTPSDVPDELIQASVRSYARYWREAFRLPSMDHAAIGGLVLQGKSHLEAALAAGRGAVLVLPHSGNWDMAGVWLVQNHGTFATVAERLKPESLFERFVAYRESLGFEVFPLTGAEQPPFVQLAKRLRENKAICLMGERDLTGRGVPVTFFGERTWLPAGAAKLAIETGAPLLPVHTWFTDDGAEGWGMKVYEPIDVSRGVAAATQALADRFAANIAAHPADWHMLQPQWESDLSEARLARIAAARSAHDEPNTAAGVGVSAASQAAIDLDAAPGADAAATPNGTANVDTTAHSDGAP
ncbi:phosphatidylinositol mannoside acyltransferase [Nocardia sp. NBC_01499]|uniref:phosphatidylinositol mannoside acyltransferase n=1 Tax=Nocardia sp. NBC_01499 TaxID=2903597 RepID=UPI003862E67C